MLTLQDSPGYTGTSGAMGPRTDTNGGHRSSAKPVNSRMKQAREGALCRLRGGLTVACGGQQRKWKPRVAQSTSANTTADDQMPFQARHCVEHWNITCFGFDSEAEGGKNVNAVDKPCHETLIPASLAIAIIKGLDKVVEQITDCLLPFGSDEWAWEAMIKPFCPGGTPAALRTFQRIFRGGSRPHIWTKVSHPNLSRYLLSDRSNHDYLFCAQSKEYQITMGIQPYAHYYTRNAQSVLAEMVAIMETVAREQMDEEAAPAPGI